MNWKAGETFTTRASKVPASRLLLFISWRLIGVCCVVLFRG